MPRLVFSALALAGVSAAALAAQTAETTEERQIGQFNELDMSGRFDVIFTPADTPRLVMQGDFDDMEDIEVNLRNGRLEIEQDRGIRRWFGRARRLDVIVFVEGPDVREFDASRGITAQINDLEVAELDVDVSTGSNIRISGSCESGDFNTSTGANLNGRELICESVRVNASTGSTMRVNAVLNLRANVSTGADVHSLTSPESVRINTSTGGDVHINRSNISERRDGRHRDRRDGRHEDRPILQDG